MAKEDQERAVIVEGEITPETVRKAFGIVAVILVGWLLFQSYSSWQMGQKIPLQQAVSEIKESQIKRIEVQGTLVLLTTKDKKNKYTQIEGSTSFSDILKNDNITLNDLAAMETEFVPNNVDMGNSLLNLLSLVMMGVVAFGVWSFVRTIQRQNATGGGLSSFGKSSASVIIGKRPNTTFADVAGAKEAKEEIKEIVDFLKNPKAFFEMGARIPRGVLLVGSPGTGKTLMARAVAGEAKVPFFHTSGPEFEEMLVGAGAARVRDLFKRAKSLAPSIIFIDEIDAVARRRGMDYKSSHSEQTLNQILVEMDGFEKRDAVIVIAATNRPDVLDPAIMRPGRFDRNIRLGLPDVAERLEVLQVHAKNKKFGSDVNLDKVAQFTVGFSGADLENLLNEAAILAVRAKRGQITQEDLSEAMLKVSMGPRRSSKMVTEDDLKRTAYHEAGHAIVGTYLKDCDPVKVITVIPRGTSMGATYSHSEFDSSFQTKAALRSHIAMSAAGRVAEELIFGAEQVSGGAASDIDHITTLANAMVKQIGMSDKAGMIVYDKGEDFDILSSKVKYSDKTADMLDQEIKMLVDSQYEVATQILKKERKLLDAVSEELLQSETLSGERFMEIVGQFGTEAPPEKPKHRSLSVSDWIKKKQVPTEEA